MPDLTIVIEDPEMDHQELENETYSLRDALIDSNGVMTVGLVHAPNVPLGTRGPDAALQIGVLVVTTLGSSGALYALLAIVRACVDRGKSRSATLEIDGDRLQLTGLGRQQQQRVVDAWARRHGGSPTR